MTRLARRNRTRRIKLWKRRGYVYRNGRFYEKWQWRAVVAIPDDSWEGVPIVWKDNLS